MNTNSVDFFNNEHVKVNIAGKKLVLALWNLKNPENIGHLIRLAHNLNATEVLFIGEESAYRESKIRKTAGMSYHKTNWKFTSPEAVLNLSDDEYKLVALETCPGSMNLFKTDLPEKMILLGGNEISGLPEEILHFCHQKIYIPMPGGCKSMNVSHAMAVGAFEWIRQHLK